MALAGRALSAFCFVTDDICSRAEEVSSTLDACSVAPEAMDWLEEETWPEAEEAATLEPAAPPSPSPNCRATAIQTFESMLARRHAAGNGKAK